MDDYERLRMKGDVIIDLLIAAMKDAAIERKLTQFKMTITPAETNKASLVRVIVVPEEMEYVDPSIKS